MANKKDSGLGRGLFDLIDDNAPIVGTKNAGGKVVVRSPEGDKEMRTTSSIYEKDKKPKNRSVLQNYK